MDKARDLVIVMLSLQQMAMDVIRYLDTLAAMRAIGAWLETEPVE
jgi:hypothetical protein